MHTDDEEAQAQAPAKKAEANAGEAMEDDNKTEKKLKPTDPEHPIQQ